MGADEASPVDWHRVDTVLLDMDGTLLDLAFDNFFWREFVPQRHAARLGVSTAQAKRELYARYAAVEGTLEWYSTEYWSRQLGLDIVALKRERVADIRYLPGALAFLFGLKDLGKRRVLVTNAHRDAVGIKFAATGLERALDAHYSAHRFATPKEGPGFWTRFNQIERFDPERTLLIEDSLTVLRSARQYGIGFLLAISEPDSSADTRRIDEFATIAGVGELLAADA